MKELIDRLNALELALNYNEAKGDDESVSQIHEEIYKVRQQIQERVKNIGV